MQIPHTVPARVREAIERGELWRAKEILSGHLSTFGYSPELYESYGCILLAMQDIPEAGRFLFFSGARRPEYQAAIQVFLSRHGRTAGAVLATAPKSLRSHNLKALPSLVATEFRERGMPRFPGEGGTEREGAIPHTSRKSWFTIAGCVIALGFVVASAPAGAPVILRFLMSFVN